MTLEEVYRTHFRFVWRALRRLGVSEIDAQDATQEVFIVVHRKLSTFEGRSQMTTWLFSICLHVARSRRRKSHARHEVQDADAIDALEDHAADPNALSEQRQRLALLDSLIDQLELDQRVVFTLFELEGMSGDEIAALLTIPLGTVYSRLRLARANFQAALARVRAKERHALGAPRQGGSR